MDLQHWNVTRKSSSSLQEKQDTHVWGTARRASETQLNLIRKDCCTLANSKFSKGIPLISLSWGNKTHEMNTQMTTGNSKHSPGTFRIPHTFSLSSSTLLLSSTTSRKASSFIWAGHQRRVRTANWDMDFIRSGSTSKEINDWQNIWDAGLGIEYLWQPCPHLQGLPGTPPSYWRCWCPPHRRDNPETPCLGSSRSSSWV